MYDLSGKTKNQVRSTRNVNADKIQRVGYSETDTRVQCT